MAMLFPPFLRRSLVVPQAESKKQTRWSETN